MHLITLKDIHPLCRTSLNENSADKTQHLAPARFKPPNSTSDQQQTYILDLAVCQMGAFIVN